MDARMEWTNSWELDCGQIWNAGYDETFRISSPTVTMKPPMTMASPHKFSTDLLTPDPEKNDYDW